jgi:hydroxymethylpyrimidine pyrophosphatase-like HAD family hydrolase
MGNAQPGVKEKADLVIGHHDEDGLALFIRERLL